MTTTFHNSNLRSNINREPPQVIPSDIAGDIIEIQFPTRLIKAVDLGNMPASTIDGYVANKKTMVQNMFNKRNLNENLNFKNTFYVEERGDLANKEANTIYGFEKVYPKQVIDADLKARYVSQAWKEMHKKSEQRVKDALRDTTNTVGQMRDEEAKELAEEQVKHAKEVRRQFKKVQSLIGTMTGSPKTSQEKFRIPNNEDESEHVGAQNIDRNPADEEGVLNNRANIRALMAARSMENQERKQAEKDAKAKLIALEEARRAGIERQEEIRVSKYMDLQKLSKSWRIPDKNKLKQVVKNEIMKDIMKEEERKNFVKIAEHMKKPVEGEKKSIIKKAPAKKRMEPPKAFSASSKKKDDKKKEDKKYEFSPQKVKKLPAESQADYRTRFNFTVMALPEQKETLDPLEQHQIMKQFQEMIVRNGVEKNGRLSLK